MNMKLVMSLALGILALTGCQTAGLHQNTGQPSHDLHTLTQWMTGSFSSAEQALTDPDNYFDIRLKMMPIWRERADGPWLYVEQAAAGKLDKPYRQRVYHLVAREDGAIESVVYTLPGEPLRFAGAWRNPARFDAFSPRDLERREGCKLVLRRQADGRFVGSTLGRKCASDLRGASYATSEAIITPTMLISWDRGFDAEGRQVWGVTEGGYMFKKVAPRVD